MRALAPMTVTDDEVDAAICALAGVLRTEHALSGRTLADEIRRRLSERDGSACASSVDVTPPKGYELLQSMPEGLSVMLERRTVADNEEMLQEVGRWVS